MEFDFRKGHPEILPGEVFLGNTDRVGHINVPLAITRRGEVALNYGYKLALSPGRRQKLFPVFVNAVEFYNVYRDDEPENCVVCALLMPYRKSTPISQREHYVEGVGQTCEVCQRMFNPMNVVGC